MASGNSSLESNNSSGSLSHNFINVERQHPITNQHPTISMDYELLNQGSYDKQSFTVKSHTYEGMNPQYDSIGQLSYEMMNKQTNDSLKQQCDKAMHELNALRRQYSETSRRCDHAMKELEYFRSQHRAAMSQLEASNQEANTLRGKYSDLLNDNQRLEREVQHLHECHGSSAEGNTTDPALLRALHKYESLKEEYEIFQKRYDELMSTHSTAIEKMQILQDENNRLKAQCHDLTKERNAVVRSLRSLRSPADLKRLTDERNAAMHEYTLIMSERDTVHKEMEKLSDDLQASLKRVAALESALQASRDEKKTLSLQAETLRREIASALQDRDRALKECSELKGAQNTSTMSKSRQDTSSYHHSAGGSISKDGFINGQHSASTSLDKLQVVGSALVVDNLEQANQELEKMRKTLDRLSNEIHEAQQEAEVSKRRRDWAFSERDKIVQERESIRTLCDRLRKERDRAVSDLAEALRDSDDIKKQRNEASKELKELKEKFESDLEKDTSTRNRHSTHNPRNSILVDSDSQNLDMETYEVDCNLDKDGELGFEMSDENIYDTGAIYVTLVEKGSPAEGKVKVGDRIIEISNSVNENVRRVKLSRAVFVRNTLRLYNRRNHLGITLAHGIFVSKIAAGSLASKEDNLQIGDRVVSINNRSVDGMKSVKEVTGLLNDTQYDPLVFTVLRPVTNTVHNQRVSNQHGISSFMSYHNGKMVNSCSQTEEHWFNENKSVNVDHGITDFDRRYVYRVAAGSQGKIQNERGTWDIILGKIEAVTGRHKIKDKQNKMIPETDAIAELDSVIDSYHGKNVPKEGSSVLKRSKRRNRDSHNSESMKNNGGTWPKARANVILEENPTGTIVQPRSRKERPPLSILWSPPTKLQPESQRSNINRNSNPIPIGHQQLTQISNPRHSIGLYKPIEVNTSSAHYPKSAPLSIHNPFPNTNIINFDKLREKDKSHEYEQDLQPNRLSLALNPSDDSLEYSVNRSGNKSPQSLEFSINSQKCPGSLEFAQTSSLKKNKNDYAMKNQGKNSLEQYYSTNKSSPTHNVSKYTSDCDNYGPESISSMGMGGTLPSQSRLQSPYYRGPFTNHQAHHARYPGSPTNIQQSQSGESIGTTYEIVPFPSHSHNMSDIQPMTRVNRAGEHFQNMYEGGTFPRKKENARFRIPSNPSVTSKNSTGKLSTGSIERSSEINSPMPTFHVDVLSPGRGAKQTVHKGTRNSMSEYGSIGSHKPLPGELRRVHIDKSQQPLGIKINCPPGSGGVFVSSVNEHSLASQVGLQVGDQLLEVCGINMRSATYTLAANVLRQCGNSITMLVQYSPEKYHELEGSGSSSSVSSSRSGSPTPRNSPAPDPDTATIRPKESSRYLMLELRNGSDLGISLVGGNAVGIFVHAVTQGSAAAAAGLRTGDHILEYNHTDLRHATAEQAALELAKPNDKVSMLVRHKLQQYHEIKDKPGDAFYIRAGFDRGAKITSAGMDTIDQYSLWFRKDEVLFVDNTLFNGVPGLWRAWQLDYKGNKQQWGTIPSKFKVEELLRRSMGSLECNDGSQRRGSTSARRSFFRRKKHRDSKELASFSNTNLGWWSDSGTLTDELPILSYQRVERLHSARHRPVVVMGPLWELVVEKLVGDWPDVFARVAWEGVGRHHTLQLISLQAINDIADKGLHCILEISMPTIEKLHKQQIYPIVLLIKFKSTKQIKEVKDTRFPMDKVSAKAAKEMFEHAIKLENEYRNYISAIIPAGVNLAYMCTQIKAAVEEEQNKTLWVPSVQT